MGNKSKINSGFTLIEIMVVIVIIGVLIGFTITSFGNFSHSKQLKNAALQLKELVLLLEHQAILEAASFDIKIDQNGYQALRFIPPAQWLIYNKNPVFRYHYFPPGTVVHLQNELNHSIEKTIHIDPTGKLKPFVMVWRHQKSWSSFNLRGHEDGHLDFN